MKDSVKFGENSLKTLEGITSCIIKGSLRDILGTVCPAKDKTYCTSDELEKI